MSEGGYQIVLDAEVGERLEQMASARGVSVRELVTAMIGAEPDIGGDAEVLRELEVVMASVEAGREQLIDHSDVSKWLATWGTGAFRPWPDRR